MGASQVAYAPQGYSNPFGSYSFNGQHQVTASPEEQTGISTRQQLLNQLLPDLNTTSDAQAKQIAQYQNTLQNQLINNSLPQYRGEMMARGLGGSTAYGTGLSDLFTKAANQGILGANDLYTQALTNKLSSGNFLESGLQNAFNRQAQIGQQGQAYNQQMFDVQNANASRMLQGDVANAQMKAAQQQAMMQGIGQLVGLGTMGLMGGGGMSFGNIGKNLGSLFGMGQGAAGGGGTGGSSGMSQDMLYGWADPSRFISQGANISVPFMGGAGTGYKNYQIPTVDYNGFSRVAGAQQGNPYTLGDNTFSPYRSVNPNWGNYYK